MLMAAFMSTQTTTNTIQDGDKQITTESVVDNHTITPLNVRQVSPIVKSENTKNRDKIGERQEPTKKYIISKARPHDSDLNNDESG